MAGRQVAFVTAAIATGTAAKTLAQVIAAANHAVRVLKWKITFQGVAVTDAPIKVDVLRQTDAGTMSALSGVKVSPAGFAETIQTTGQHTATAEPTAGDVVDSLYVHPQSGFAEVAAMGQEIDIAGGGRLGFRVTAGASVNAIVSALIEE